MELGTLWMNGVGMLVSQETLNHFGLKSGQQITREQSIRIGMYNCSLMLSKIAIEKAKDKP